MIGLLVRDTILLRRALDCDPHDWQPAEKPQTPDEETCTRCGVSATPEGKTKLAEMAAHFHRRPTLGSRTG